MLSIVLYSNIETLELRNSIALLTTRIILSPIRYTIKSLRASSNLIITYSKEIGFSKII